MMASTDSMLSDLSDLSHSDADMQHMQQMQMQHHMSADRSYASDAFSDTYSQSDYSTRDDLDRLERDGKATPSPLSTSSSYSDLRDLNLLSRSSSRLSHSSLQSSQSEVSKNFKVVIRVRPPLPRELQTLGPKKFVNIVEVTEDHRGIVLSENAGAAEDPMGGVYTKHAFTFDHVYGEHRGQRDVYEQTARDAVLSTLQGYNATIIAYGQTGTGKTYTMEVRIVLFTVGIATSCGNISGSP
jgi:hypothetical protein